MTVCFLGLFVNGRYHTACRYSGPMVWNSASVTFLKICYYGRQWDLIWCNDTFSVLIKSQYFPNAIVFQCSNLLYKCEHMCICRKVTLNWLLVTCVQAVVQMWKVGNRAVICLGFLNLKQLSTQDFHPLPKWSTWYRERKINVLFNDALNTF